VNIKNKNKLVVRSGVLVIAVSIFSYQYFEIGKTSEIIWEHKSDTTKDVPYISKVGIYEESCNEIVYEIFYENVKQTPSEILELGVNHKEVNSGYAKKEDGTLDYSSWIHSEGGRGLRGLPSSEPKDGSGSIKYRGWITPETKSAETDGFSVLIRVFDEKDNQIQSFKQVNLKRTKVWDNSCI
jgi:hypothetical protein